MATEQEIRNLYSTRFGKTGDQIDQEGLNYWMGQDLETATTNFDNIYRDTYNTTYNPTTIQTSTSSNTPTYNQPTQTATEEEVRGLYSDYFGKTGDQVDQEGLNYWMNKNLNDVQTSFGNIYKDLYGKSYESPQSTSTLDTNWYNTDSNGNLTYTIGDNTFTKQSGNVEDWYKNTYNKVGDAEGIAYWNKQLSNATTDEQKNAVWKAFIDSGTSIINDQNNTTESYGIYDTGIYDSVYDIAMQSGLYQIGIPHPGEFTGTTWQELQEYKKLLALYEADQTKPLPPKKKPEEPINTNNESIIDNVSDNSKRDFTKRTEREQFLRDDYFAQLMRTQPQQFEMLLERYKYLRPELYKRLLAIKEGRTKDTTNLFNDERVAKRIDYLRYLKGTQPEVLTKILETMKQFNPNLYTKFLEAAPDLSTEQPLEDTTTTTTGVF